MKYKISFLFFLAINLAYQTQSNAAEEGQENKETTRRSQKSGDKTTIDFDSIDILGSRRDPMSTLIDQKKNKKEFDFVKIRLRWHPEMISSTSSLDSN